MERISTYIKGFDEIISGGFPAGSNILISGGPGTGKTIFVLEVLYRNAMLGKKVKHFTFEQTEKELLEQLDQFGFNDKKILKKIEIKEMNTNKPEDLFKDLKLMDKQGYEIVSIDSISAMMLDPMSEEELSSSGKNKVHSDVKALGVENFNKIKVKKVIDLLKNTKVTAFLVSETDLDSNAFSRDKLSEYFCDGIVKLSSVEGEDFRSLSIPKMRKTNHKRGVYSFEITSKGLNIGSGE